MLTRRIFASVFFMMFFLWAGCSAWGSEDVLIADFEGANYGNWEVTGDAFGTGPAAGKLPGQQDVAGFKGEGLANSRLNGNGSTGTLTSPEFTVERAYINFLIGGGGHAGKTCVNLIVDGKIVRTEVGAGIESLNWRSWDVKDLAGKTARIEIVDEHKEGLGHVNVDHIYQSDDERKIIANKKRKMTLRKKYINFPVRNGASQRLISLFVDGERVREFAINLALEKPDYWVFLDISEFEGEKAELQIDEYDVQGKVGFDKIFQDNTYPGQDKVYKEKLRPQFHFTAQRGWTNDTNGMVYYDGEYHLFYQRNPYNWFSGNWTSLNRSWGHAVSDDLIHWVEIADAIHPDETGTIFSGSAVVDENNTAGFQTGKEKPIVCFYTAAGGTSAWSAGQPFVQSIAYSNDRGRTFTKYEGNPIIKTIEWANRDPKVIWHEQSQQWVQVLYIGGGNMDFFTSQDLKSWKFESRLKSFDECPELFELPVDGDKTNTKWVIYGGSGSYFVGSFDGKEFKPESERIRYSYGNCFYASQLFNNISAEDGRKIQMAWGMVTMPDMPFNQMVLFPVTLSLRTTDDGIRMFANPVREIEKLHKKKYAYKRQEGFEGKEKLRGIKGELIHIVAEFEAGTAEKFGLVVRDVPILYDNGANKLSCLEQSAPLKKQDGRIKLEILVDRTTIEIFANDGEIYMPVRKILVDNPEDIALVSEGGKAKVNYLEVYELDSIWR